MHSRLSVNCAFALQFVGIAYAAALVVLFVGASRAWISYEKNSAYQKVSDVLLQPIRVQTEDCKPTPSSAESYLSISLIQKEGKGFLARYDLVILPLEATVRENIYVNKTKVLRFRGGVDDLGLGHDREPREPWGFPVKLKRGWASWLYTSEDEVGGLISGLDATFLRPYDKYYAGFSMAARASSSATAPKFKQSFPSLSWFQLGDAKDVSIGSIRIVPPEGFRVVPMNSLQDLGPFELDYQEHEFLSDSCDIYLFQLRREPTEILFGSFLLALALLPVILLLSGDLVRGVEFLGAIGSVGLLRIAVVGADRHPYRVDIFLGGVLLAIALILTHRAIGDYLRRSREEGQMLEASRFRNHKRWRGSTFR